MRIAFFKRWILSFLVLAALVCVLYILRGIVLNSDTCEFQSWPTSWIKGILGSSVINDDACEGETQSWIKGNNALNVATCEFKSRPKSWIKGTLTQLRPLVPANCNALFEGNTREIGRVESELRSWQNSVSDEEFLRTLTNCSYIVSLFSDEFYVSRAELEFPLAFLLTVHDYPQQVIRLLRVLYRPHNVYCVHVDAKANPEIIRAFRKLSQCLPNFLFPRKLTTIFYIQGESILEAQLSCLELIRDAHVTWKWRYVMNLCGTELPLLTNREIVDGLRRMQGRMSIDDDDFPESMMIDRFSFRYKIDQQSRQPIVDYTDTFGPPPFGIKLHKSTTYNIMSYSFTEFILTNFVAIALRKYIKGAGNAEEHFYASLFWLPEAPVKEPDGETHMRLTASIWESSPNSNLTCRGTFRNEVCIVGVANLNYIRGYQKLKKHLFFNKYFSSQDHVIMNCVEEHLVRQNQLEYLKDCHQRDT